MVNWHHNEWYPDTCDCGIQFVFDEDLPDTQRVHVFFAKLKPCSKHPTLEGTILWNTVVDENSRIQKLRSFAKANITSISTIDDQGSTITLNQSWSGSDESRVVTISFSGVNLTTSQKTTLQGWCDTNLGTGKVKIG